MRVDDLSQFVKREREEVKRERERRGREGEIR